MRDFSNDIPTLFAGGRLCLDFINTFCEVVGAPVELIGSGQELRHWLGLAETVIGKPLSPEETVWEGGYGERILPRAIALREALREIVLGAIEGKPVSDSAMETVNALLRENPVYPQIGRAGVGFTESFAVRHPDDRWLAIIAQDAVNLLCESDLSLLRQCECPTCIRVFYDTTKNHRRRWCVEKCGSKPKAAAYYRRKVARAAKAER